MSDLGVSNERTALAWQRTALALMAGTTIMARLTFEDLGWMSLVVLSVALVLCGWVFIESRGRYSHTAGLRPRRGARGGRAPAALAVATVLVAATEIAALAARGS